MLKIGSIDLLALTELMSKRELIVMNLLKSHFVWETDLDSQKRYTLGVSSVTEDDILNRGISVRTFQKGFNELKNRGLAKKLSKNVYMFNPKAIIPSKPLTALDKWNNL